MEEVYLSNSPLRCQQQQNQTTIRITISIKQISTSSQYLVVDLWLAIATNTLMIYLNDMKLITQFVSCNLVPFSLSHRDIVSALTIIYRRSLLISVKKNVG